MKIYLSGPMTGKPKFNFSAFNNAAKELRAMGYEVLNPAENFEGRTDLPRKVYMRRDIETLLKAEAVALLPGFEDSAGAALEMMIAKELGLRIYVYEDRLLIEVPPDMWSKKEGKE